jgi:hypothetical protein
MLNSFLSLLYVLFLNNGIQPHCFTKHLHLKDPQKAISSLDLLPEFLTCISTCLLDISIWMSHKYLKLNIFIPYIYSVIGPIPTHKSLSSPYSFFLFKLNFYSFLSKCYDYLSIVKKTEALSNP